MSQTSHIDTRDKYVFGFWLYIMSDCLLFASLFATYAVLHNNSAGGPGPEDLFSLPFVLLETLILLSSSFTMGLSIIAMQGGKKTATLCALALTTLLGASFVFLEI